MAPRVAGSVLSGLVLVAGLAGCSSRAADSAGDSPSNESLVASMTNPFRPTPSASATAVPPTTGW